MSIMVKVIRLGGYQNMVNYRKPSSIALQDSYKLPPYSTVIGMIHNVCGFNEYHSMKVSISGRYATSITDIYTRYFFGIALERDKGRYLRHQLYTERLEGKGLGGHTSYLEANDIGPSDKDGITRSLGYYELIVDVELVIHIIPEKEEDFDIIYRGLKCPRCYPSLGRHEDLLRIDDIRVVELKEAHQDDDIDEGLRIDYDVLVPIKDYDKNKMKHEGTVITYNKVFCTKDKEGEPLKIRKITERVKAKLIKAKGEPLFGNFYYDDTEGEIVGVFPA